MTVAAARGTFPYHCETLTRPPRHFTSALEALHKITSINQGSCDMIERGAGDCETRIMK